MSAFVRANWTVRTGETTRLVSKQFVGRQTGVPIDFSWCGFTLTWGYPSGLLAVATPVLAITQSVGPNGRVWSSCGRLIIDVEPAGALTLLTAGPLLQHLLKVTYANGRSKDFIEGASAIVPGW